MTGIVRVAEPEGAQDQRYRMVNSSQMDDWVLR